MGTNELIIAILNILFLHCNYPFIKMKRTTSVGLKCLSSCTSPLFAEVFLVFLSVTQLYTATSPKRMMSWSLQKETNTQSRKNARMDGLKVLVLEVVEVESSLGIMFI